MIYYILHAQHNEHIIFYITINIKQYTREESCYLSVIKLKLKFKNILF